MNSTDRPYFTFQSLLIEYVGATALAKQAKAYVNLGDWLRIVEAVGRRIHVTEHGDGSKSILYEGIQLIYRPDLNLEDGVYDLRDPDNPHIIRD
jgi:hypothetical protein